MSMFDKLCEEVFQELYESKMKKKEYEEGMPNAGDPAFVDGKKVKMSERKKKKLKREMDDEDLEEGEFVKGKKGVNPFAKGKDKDEDLDEMDDDDEDDLDEMDDEDEEEMDFTEGFKKGYTEALRKMKLKEAKKKKKVKETDDNDADDVDGDYDDDEEVDEDFPNVGQDAHVDGSALHKTYY